MNEFDPDAVNIRPAATVMLIEDRPDLQVFMMERHANTIFAGGMWVFPGGSVDAGDDSLRYQEISIHRSDAEASALLGIPSGGLAYYVAAIREAFEESGILLARHRDSEAPLRIDDEETAARFQQHRDHVNDGTRDFLDIVDDENLILDVGQMHYIARWITPKGPPRRFDARFFIAKIPAYQTPVHDDGELVHSEWLKPNEILDAFDAEKMVLMSPTLRMVKNLAMFDSSNHVIDTVSQDPEDHQARVHATSGLIVMPGEPGYDDGLKDVETGWVRLHP